jgi:hypothetical protein
VRFRHSLVRALVGVVEIWLVFGTVAILTSLVSPRGKRVGDYLAGTVVVRERVPTQAAAIVSMPPQLATWAAGLELSRLPDALALAVRQMLGRTQDLSPQSRAQMAQRMAYEVSRYVSPSPPVGCPPELYLSAVLAERRRRELVRQARQTQQVPAVFPIPQPIPAPQVSGADPDGFRPPG